VSESMQVAIEDVRASGSVASAVPRSVLTSVERHEMFSLLDRHFEGVTPEQFDRDLNEKHWVLRLRRDGRLVGFSTLQLVEAEHRGRLVRVVYAGDTIVAPEAWGSPVLARAWIALVRAIQASASDAPWYWLLLSSGFRTYRFLPVFWRQFWPRCDAATPSAEQDLMRVFARLLFGDQYDEAAGVVRFSHPQRLRSALADVPSARSIDPHVAFFLLRNRGYTQGDELVCLTDLSDTNLTAAGRRMVGRPEPCASGAGS